MPPFSTHPPLSTIDVNFLRAALHPTTDSTPALRFDGRLPASSRPISYSFPAPATHTGTVEVAVGETRVLAAISADIVPPHADRPAEGLLSILVDLSPVGSSHYTGGKRSIQQGSSVDGVTIHQMEIERTIHRVLRDARALDTESLCLVAGKSVWSVRLDLHIINNAGNALDACLLASLTALLHYRRLDVTVVGDTLTVHPADERQPVPLVLSHMPVSTTWAAIPNTQTHITAGVGESVSSSGQTHNIRLVIDPTSREEAAATGVLSITTNNYGEILNLHQSGGNGFTAEQISACVQTAAERAQSILVTMKQSIDSDLQRRAVARRTRVDTAMAPIDMVEQLESKQGRNGVSVKG